MLKAAINWALRESEESKAKNNRRKINSKQQQVSINFIMIDISLD
jgi:hypothetical protein